MFEMSLRLLLAGTALFLGGMFGTPKFETAAISAAALILIATFSIVMQSRKKWNSGIAGLVACAEAATLAYFLSGVGLLDSLGVLVLVPCLWAWTRYESQLLAMAPLAGGSLLLAHNFGSGGEIPGVDLLAHTGAILALAALIERLQPKAEPVIKVDRALPAPSPVPLLEHLELREKYRDLRSEFEQLSERAKRDHVTALLADVVRTDSADDQGLLEALYRLAPVESLSLYRLSEVGDRMVVSATRGETEVRHVVTIDSGASADVIVRRASEALRTTPVSGMPFRNVPLFHGSKTVGMISLRDSNLVTLDAAHRSLEAAAETIARVAFECAERRSVRARLQEAELLYELSALTKGAESRVSAAKRFCREIAEAIFADSVCVYLVDTDSLVPVAKSGPETRLIEAMSFANGPGLAGWIATGAPELNMFDARDDDRCPSEDALRLRVGSYLASPILDGDDVVGLVTAHTAITNGLDLRAAETLRVASAELGQAFARLDGRDEEPQIMNPDEFREFLQGKSGHLVHLQIPARERLIRTFGRLETERAVRTLLRRVRSRLPEGSVVCRRSKGDLVVFLPAVDASFAQRWTNEMAAAAALIGLRSLDGKTRIPLGLRGKTAALYPQETQLLEGLHAA
jgi:GGDEF domain-containing protein